MPAWLTRAFVAVMAFRYLGTAWVLRDSHDAFERSEVFRYVFEIAAPSTWAHLFALFGVVAAGIAAFRPRPAAMQGLLVISVGLSTSWALAFVAAQAFDGAPAALATVTFTVLAAKDLILSAAPMEVSLRRLVQTWEREQEG